MIDYQVIEKHREAREFYYLCALHQLTFSGDDVIVSIARRLLYQDVPAFEAERMTEADSIQFCEALYAV